MHVKVNAQFLIWIVQKAIQTHSSSSIDFELKNNAIEILDIRSLGVMDLVQLAIMIFQSGLVFP